MILAPLAGLALAFAVAFDTGTDPKAGIAGFTAEPQMTDAQKGNAMRPLIRDVGAHVEPLLERARVQHGVPLPEEVCDEWQTGDEDDAGEERGVAVARRDHAGRVRATGRARRSWDATAMANSVRPARSASAPGARSRSPAATRTARSMSVVDLRR